MTHPQGGVQARPPCSTPSGLAGSEPLAPVVRELDVGVLPAIPARVVDGQARGAAIGGADAPRRRLPGCLGQMARPGPLHVSVQSFARRPGWVRKPIEETEPGASRAARTPGGA